MLARYLLSSCVRPSPSVTSRYCIETTGRIELVFSIEASFPHRTLCGKEIWVSPKVRALTFRTLSQTLDFKNFATAIRSHCQENSSSSSMVELVDDTYVYDNRQVVAVYYKSVNCNPLIPLLRFVVDLLYNLLLQLTRFSLTQRVARSVCGNRASC